MVTADDNSQQNLKRDFVTFLNQSGSGRQPRNDAERETLFREFMAWRQKQSNAGN
jgi:hypothetical protein